MRSRRWSLAAPLAALLFIGTSCGGESSPAPEEPAAVEPTPAPVESTPPLVEPAPAARAHPQDSDFVAGAPLPDTFPTDLPALPDAQYLGSFVEPREGGAAARYETAKPLEEAVEQLRTLYSDGGWEIQESLVQDGRGMIFASQGSERVVLTTLVSAPDGKTTIDVFAAPSP